MSTKRRWVSGKDHKHAEHVAEGDRYERGNQEDECVGRRPELGSEEKDDELLSGRDDERETAEHCCNKHFRRRLQEEAVPRDVSRIARCEKRKDRRRDTDRDELRLIEDSIRGSVQSGILRSRELENEKLVDTSVRHDECAADGYGNTDPQQLGPPVADHPQSYPTTPKRQNHEQHVGGDQRQQEPERQQRQVRRRGQRLQLRPRLPRERC